LQSLRPVRRVAELGSFDQMSMSPSRRRFVIAAGLIVALPLCAAALLPLLARTSNCGGNSAALAACKGYITVLRLWGYENEGHMFHFDQTDQETRRSLGHLPGASWIHSARLLARLDDVRIDPVAEKRILMVCDHPYDNVPQRRFGRSPLAYAVAYSTGETGLISADEFARLDLSDFIDLQALPSTAKVEPSGAANAASPHR